MKVSFDGFGGFGSDGNDAFLAAFAEDSDGVGFQIEVAHVDGTKFRAAKSGGVEKFENRFVAKRDAMGFRGWYRGFGVRRDRKVTVTGEDLAHRSFVDNIGQPLFGFRSFDEASSIEFERAALHQEFYKGANGCEFSSNGTCFDAMGASGLLRCQDGEIAAQNADIIRRSGKSEPLRFQDTVEIDQITFVRLDGLWTGIALVLQIFEKGAKPKGEIGVEIYHER